MCVIDLYVFWHGWRTKSNPKGLQLDRWKADLTLDSLGRLQQAVARQYAYGDCHSTVSVPGRSSASYTYEEVADVDVERQ